MEQAFLTSRDLGEIFGVSMVTLGNWRKGTQSLSALPEKVDPVTKQPFRHPRFDPKSVAGWADQNGVPCHHDPLSVAKNWQATSARRKPGPKPRFVILEHRG